MRLIATKLGSGKRADRLRFLREDGTGSDVPMPRQGILPHDLVHYAVESTLGLTHGFLGLVAGGADPAFVMELAHRPDAREVERQAIQAEAIVEGLQSQLWSGPFDVEAFLYGVETASLARGVDPQPFPDRAAATRLWDAALELQRRWRELPAHASLELEFPPIGHPSATASRCWHALALGDALTAQVPLGQIEEAVARHLATVGHPPAAAVYTRQDSEGRLHCEVTAYFTPALAGLGRALGARPTSRPPRAGLTLLVGTEGAFDASA